VRQGIVPRGLITAEAAPFLDPNWPVPWCWPYRHPDPARLDPESAAPLGGCGHPAVAGFSQQWPADYYPYATTNQYARIVRATTSGGRGYAFPYDDVACTRGADQSGAVFDPAPALFTVTLG